MGTVMSLISDTRASLNAQRAKLKGVRESDGDYAAPAPEGQHGTRNGQAVPVRSVRSRKRQDERDVDSESL